MFQRVLVPLDGSEEAERVLPPLGTILGAGGARAVLLRAVYCPLARNPHEATLVGELERAAISYLADAAGRVKAAGGVETRVRHGDPALTILRAAEEEACDLIAMTTRGRGAVVRFLIGSVAEKVVRHSPVPVLALRSAAGAAGPRPPGPFRSLLVPLDGSMGGEEVIPAAVVLARLHGARILLFRAVEPLEVEADLLSLAPDRERIHEADLRLEALTAEIRRQGPDVLAHVQKGDPATEILKFAAENSADLICMTTHGRSGPGRWMLGSVAERVLRHSPVPVFLARRKGR